MLPAWFDEQVKHFKPVVDISWNGTHAVAEVGEVIYYGTPWEVYEQIDINNAPYDITFNPNLEGHGGTFLLPGWFDPDDPGSGNMMGLTDEDHYHLYENSYRRFLDLDKRREENPDDSLIAYDWLSHHPAFWWQRDGHWMLDNGIDELYVCVSSTDGHRYVLIEGGGTIRENTVYGPFGSHYHDIRLDVVGTSLDDAYVKHAKKVYEHFDKEGNEREDAPEV